jgi:hypothetical protein
MNYSMNPRNGVGGINSPTNNQTNQLNWLSKTYWDVYWDVDVGAGGHAAFDDAVSGGD